MKMKHNIFTEKSNDMLSYYWDFEKYVATVLERDEGIIFIMEIGLIDLILVGTIRYIMQGRRIRVVFSLFYAPNC